MIDDEGWHRAVNYPYDWPGHCYLFSDGKAVANPDRARYRRGRTPVLAYGSNRAPEQLVRKFGRLGDHEAILVEACTVFDTDVIHSAHLTNYGAIPAAIRQHPGVKVEVAVTWLTPDQLRIMDISEKAGINYGRSLLEQQVVLADDSFCDRVEAYATSHGPLTVNEMIVGHADITASGRIAPVMRNIEVLNCAHRNFAAEMEFVHFIHRIISEESFRGMMTEQLKKGLDH